ncbi:MAG: leucine-rich repeat protein [Alistipes sp.]|nr:leucine-rich repeat protein [Alistipes sp.]
MKKLFLLLALLGMVAVGCSKDEVDKGNDNKTEQPNENEGGNEENIPENIFFGLDKESVTISPDGGSVDVIVYSNYKWEISGTSDWCTPSVKKGDANEDGQIVSFSADVAYDDREATFWFRCADEKIKFVVSQKLKEVIIPDANNTFNITAEGGVAVISYQTSVDCDVIIPEYAQDWITIAPASRGLVSEGINLDIAENTTYSARTAVIRVVAKDNAELVVEYTINQEQNDAVLANGNTEFTIDGREQQITIKHKSNIDCEVIIPEYAQSWITIAPATRGLVSESITLNIAENTPYSARTAVIKVVAKDNAELAIEYTINQEQNDVILADDNNTFAVPSAGGEVAINYQTNIDCEVIIPKDAQSWITITPATRGLVSENINLDISENTTYSARTAVVKVVAKDNAELAVEYTINQEQNDAILANGNTEFTISGREQQITIKHKANIDCGVIIPDKAQDWVTIAPATRGLSTYSTTLNIAENNSGEERSCVVKVVSKDNNKLSAEYTIIQNPRYCLYYTSNDGKIVQPNNSSAFGATIVSNTYIEGVGVIEFDAPITTIGGCAFSDCNSLESVTIPDSVTTIGYYAFDSCNSLTSATIPNSVTTIGNFAFRLCSGLTSVTIPDSVTEIGEWAFADCSSLTSVTIPDSVTEIGEWAFDWCKSLTSVTIGDSVTTIGSCAFYKCSGLTSVTIPDSVTSIGSSAFADCSSLTSVTIGDSVTTIGNNAFYGCSSLTSVTIGNSVTTIGSRAFYSCNSLTNVYCKATTPPAGGYKMFYNDASGPKIYVPMGSVEAYKSAEGWSDYASDIVGYNFENGVVVPKTHPNNEIWYTSTDGNAVEPILTHTIGSAVIESFKENIISNNYQDGKGVIVFEDDVTEVGYAAFNGCSKLLTINLSTTVETIGNYTFYNCTNLSQITLSDNITYIGGYAFCGCSNLCEVYCESAIPPTGNNYMFDGNASNRKIYVPMESVEAYKSASGWSRYADAIEGYNF